ncbi:MAG: polysulfide reductase [Deltaproteobacteria bacterium RBG_16_71_12]|nr:MAG: polysulfide reductase [Deltaproteobacteria bacterium RBG_16_71_12]
MDSLKVTLSFLIAAGRVALGGGWRYRAWLLACALACLPGAWAYWGQLQDGLVVTGMSDQVSWGVYIANFTYLVGVAAAAVMLVIPSYVFHNEHTKSVVLLAEALAVAACLMAMLFVFVDLGRPERGWHLIPMLGRLNWPTSLMAWDVVVVFGYLIFNVVVPFLLLLRRWRGDETPLPRLAVIIGVGIVWAIALHTVTAFLFSANAARPFWHTALLGPRFLTSAFASGPALLLLAFRVVKDVGGFPVPRQVYRFLAIVVAVALQINLVMLGAELFTEFYAPTEHGASAAYLFLGHEGHVRLVPWIYTAAGMQLAAMVLLIAPAWNHRLHNIVLACALCVVGVWIEKGLGLIVPGFIPTPIGEVLEYVPSLTETLVSFSIWAFGALVFTLLAKPAIAIQLGTLRSPSAPVPAPAVEGETP